MAVARAIPPAISRPAHVGVDRPVLRLVTGRAETPGPSIHVGEAPDTNARSPRRVGPLGLSLALHGAVAALCLTLGMGGQAPDAAFKIEMVAADSIPDPLAAMRAAAAPQSAPAAPEPPVESEPVAMAETPPEPTPPEPAPVEAAEAPPEPVIEPLPEPPPPAVQAEPVIEAPPMQQVAALVAKTEPPKIEKTEPKAPPAPRRKPVVPPPQPVTKAPPTPKRVAATPPKPVLAAATVPAETAPAPMRAAPPSSAPAVASSAPQAARAAESAKAGLAVIRTPRFRSRPDAPRYPRRSLALNEEGVVIVRALVGPDGNSGEVVVHRSSGFARLDDAARRAVSGWAFEPARIAGQLVYAWIEVPVRFAIR
jgi:protein TonB